MEEAVSEARRTSTPNSADRTVSRTVGVWDLPLRLWHWLLAGFVLVAWFTPNVYDGLHRIAGYTVIGLLAFRLIWGPMEAATRASAWSGSGFAPRRAISGICAAA